MHALLEILRIVLPAAYGLVLLSYIGIFVRDDLPARRFATHGLVAALVLHAVSLALGAFTLHRQPIASPPEALTFIAFAVAVVHWVVEVNYKNQGAGAFIIAVVFIFQLIASASSRTVELTNPILSSPWFGLHTGSAILGYSGFAVSAAYGLLFLLLYRELKASRFGRLYERLPSLDVLSRMTIGAAGVGLAFLSIAITVGIIWSSKLVIDAWSDPKFLVTVLLWFVYALCVGAHHFLGWSGRRVVYFSLVGFTIMIFSLAVVNLFFHSFHSFAGRGASPPAGWGG